MTTIEQAIAAQEAARSRYRELPADVPEDIEEAVYLEMIAAGARLSGLFQEERRKKGFGVPDLDQSPGSQVVEAAAGRHC